MNLVYVSCFLILLASSLVTPSRHTSCSHTEDLDQTKHVHIFPRDKTGEGMADRDDGRLRTRRNANTFDETFTMLVEYDDTFTTGLSADIRQRIQNNVMPELKEFFESVLMVRSLPGPILLNRDCTGGTFYTLEGNQYCTDQCETVTMCNTATVTQDHLNRCRECNGAQQVSSASDCTQSSSDGSGADASFVLYVSAVTTGSCPVSQGSGSTLAFAGSCEMEDQFDRPIAGYVNFCPVSIGGSQSDEYLLTVAKHEVLHALGFSSGLYKWWRDENGIPRSTRNADGVPTQTSSSTLNIVTYTDWSTFNGDVSKTVSLLVTPRIMEEGRRHFNCSTLEGVQVEDQGGSGTVGSHWEARITKGEAMNGVISNDGVFSRMTFALLEDSGWYKVNYSYAEQLVWGRASGCELAAGSCGGYIKSQQQQNKPISPFCDYMRSPATLYRCNVQRTAVSNCNLATFSGALPTEYQYFMSSDVGGAFQTSDYCPFQAAFSNTICSDTANSKSGLDNSLAETFGPGSRCVEHGRPWRASEGNLFIQQPFTRSGCYDYTCSNGQVTIHILDQSYICTTGGQELNVSQTSNGITYTGSIICPSCLEICYDDFSNCPEAAQLYSEFLGTSDDTNIISTPADASISSPSSTSTTHHFDTPLNTNPTRPSSSPAQAVYCLVTLMFFLVLSVYSNV